MLMSFCLHTQWDLSLYVGSIYHQDFDDYHGDCRKSPEEDYLVSSKSSVEEICLEQVVCRQKKFHICHRGCAHQTCKKELPSDKVYRCKYKYKSNIQTNTNTNKNI